MCSFVAHNGKKYVCQEMLTLPYFSGRTTHLILDLLKLESRMRNKDTQDPVSTMLRLVGLLFPNLVWYVGPCSAWWRRTPWWCSCSPTCAARGLVGSRNPPVVGTWYWLRKGWFEPRHSFFWAITNILIIWPSAEGKVHLHTWMADIQNSEKRTK